MKIPSSPNPNVSETAQSRNEWLERNKSRLITTLCNHNVVSNKADLHEIVRTKLNWPSDIGEYPNRCIQAAMCGKTGLWHFDGSTDSWWFSPAVSASLGYATDVFHNCHRTYLLHVHPNDRRRVITRIQGCLKKESPLYLKYRIKDSEGNWIPVRASGDVVSESPLVIAGTVTVISEEEHLAQAALNSVDSMRDIYVFAKDEQYRFTYVNKPLAAQFGMTPSQMIGLKDEDIILDQGQVEAFRSTDETILHGRYGIVMGCPTTLSASRVVIEQEPLLTQNGLRFLHTVKERLRLPNGHVQILGVAIDITDSVRRDQIHQADSDMLSGLLNAFDACVWIKDVNGRFLRVNDRFAELHGYDHPDQVHGKTDFDHWITDVAQRFTKEDKEIIESQQVRGPYRETIQSRNGTEFRFLTTKRPLFDAENRIVAVLGIGVELSGVAGEQIEYAVGMDRVCQTQNVLQAALRFGNVHFHTST